MMIYYSQATTVARERDMTIVNGYEIAKVECSGSWGVLKIGATGGLVFKTKRAALAWAKAQAVAA